MDKGHNTIRIPAPGGTSQKAVDRQRLLSTLRREPTNAILIEVLRALLEVRDLLAAPGTTAEVVKPKPAPKQRAGRRKRA